MLPRQLINPGLMAFLVLSGAAIVASVIARDTPLPETLPATTQNTSDRPTSAELMADDQHGDVTGWPQLFGPTQNSISPKTDVITEWSSAGPSLVWETPAGDGYSSPVVWGDAVILFHRLGDDEVVECLNAESGARLWEYRYPTSFQCRYEYSNGPYSTPTISDSRVYTLGAEGRMHCLKLEDGSLVWSRHLTDDYQVPQGMYAVGHTPLIEGDRLILNVGGTVGESGIVALDKNTGETLWAATDHGASYAMPRAATVHGRRYVYVLTAYGLVSLDPVDGTVHWKIKFQANHPDSVSATTPLVFEDKVLVSIHKAGTLCVRILENGQCEELWRDRRNFVSQFNPMVCVDGFVYGWHALDGGFRCIELATGDVRWTSPSHVSSGSHVAVGNRMVLLAKTGHLASYDVNPDEPIERSLTSQGLLETPCFSAPALHRGLLYLRNQKKLVCLNLRRQQADSLQRESAQSVNLDTNTN